MLNSADAERIAKYTPNLPPDVWAAVGDFVREAITECVGRVSHPTDQMLSPTANLVVWAHEQGLPLNSETVFSRRTIALYIDRGCGGLARRSRSSYRSLLMRMGTVLAPEHHPARTPRVAPGPVSIPYTRAEQAALRSWTRGWTTRYRRENAAILLALGFGAGLLRGEMSEIRHRHITVDPDGVLIEVVGGERPRTVPLRVEWEEAIVDAVNMDRPPDEHLLLPRSEGPRRHIIVDFNRPQNLGAPSAGRMRATWFVDLLATGIPARALLAAAGFKNLESFDHFTQFLPDPDPVVARSLLRGKARS